MHYIVPAVIFYIPYLLFMVLVGASMSSIEQLTSTHSWNNMSQAEQWKLIFTLVLCFITVIIMIVFIIYTVVVFRRIRREIREQKKREQGQANDGENRVNAPVVVASIQDNNGYTAVGRNEA